MYELEYDSDDEYVPPTPKRRASAATVGHDSTFQERHTQAIPVASPRRRNHFLFYLGVGMCVCLAGWVLWMLVVVPWWTGVQTHWQYGDPAAMHVATLTANVGHGGTSTIMALDNNGQLTVIELVSDKASVYTGGNFLGSQKPILTLSLDSSTSRPNLIVHVIGMEGAFVLYNTGAAFSWTNA